MNAARQRTAWTNIRTLLDVKIAFCSLYIIMDFPIANSSLSLLLAREDDPMNAGQNAPKP